MKKKLNKNIEIKKDMLKTTLSARCSNFNKFLFIVIHKNLKNLA